MAAVVIDRGAARRMDLSGTEAPLKRLYGSPENMVDRAYLSQGQALAPAPKFC
jgi:hypothetical protein